MAVGAARLARALASATNFDCQRCWFWILFPLNEPGHCSRHCRFIISNHLINRLGCSECISIRRLHEVFSITERWPNTFATKSRTAKFAANLALSVGRQCAGRATNVCSLLWKRPVACQMPQNPQNRFQSIESSFPFEKHAEPLTSLTVLTVTGPAIVHRRAHCKAHWRTSNQAHTKAKFSELDFEIQKPSQIHWFKSKTFEIIKREKKAESNQNIQSIFELLPAFSREFLKFPNLINLMHGPNASRPCSRCCRLVVDARFYWTHSF